MQKERETEAKRQRDGKTERKKNSTIYRQRERKKSSTYRQRDGKTERRKDREMERQRDGKTERRKDRETERQRDRKTERQKDRETERLKDSKIIIKIINTLWVLSRCFFKSRQSRSQILHRKTG